MNKVQSINYQSFGEKMRHYAKHPFSLLAVVIVCLAAVVTVFILLLLVGYILIRGIPNITPDLFAWKYTSDNVSMMPAIINTLTMTGVTLLIAVPVGVFSAIYLVEYAKRGNKLVGIVRMTTETLAGIPSIVYGLFGYLIFVIALKFGLSMLSGALTLAIMVLPTIMRTTEEALQAVPGQLPGRKFRLGCGSSPYGISCRIAVSRSGYPIRCDSGDRTYCWRNSRPDLYFGYGSRYSGQSDGIRPYVVCSYVRTIVRGPTYRRGLCDSSDSVDHGDSDQCAVELPCEADYRRTEWIRFKFGISNSIMAISKR